MNIIKFSSISREICKLSSQIKKRIRCERPCKHALWTYLNHCLKVGVTVTMGSFSGNVTSQWVLLLCCRCIWHPSEASSCQGEIWCLLSAWGSQWHRTQTGTLHAQNRRNMYRESPDRMLLTEHSSLNISFEPSCLSHLFHMATDVSNSHTWVKVREQRLAFIWKINNEVD